MSQMYEIAVRNYFRGLLHILISPLSYHLFGVCLITGILLRGDIGVKLNFG